MKSEFVKELDEIFANVDDRAEAEAWLALDIASQFAALRQRRGLSQSQLAEKLGKSQQAISKIENPTHQGHNLARLKEVLGELDATLDVTIVPLEDLDAYRARFTRKPVLEARLVERERLETSGVSASAGSRTAESRSTRGAAPWSPKLVPQSTLTRPAKRRPTALADYLNARKEARRA